MTCLDRVRLLAEAERARAEAREEFFAFRQYLRPNAFWNWWAQQVALELQQFHEDFVAGKRPKLVLMHRLSTASRRRPKTISPGSQVATPISRPFTQALANELGVTRNLTLQRIFKSPLYRQVFSNTRIDMPSWLCNNEVIEFAGHAGSFRNITVNGQITGMELHLGVVDDPIKGRAEANSPLVRDRIWQWLVDDFCTRFAAISGMLMIMTRWHVDDPVGRFIDQFPNVRALRYPAIAECKEEFRDVGEALFPEFKPLELLLERKKTQTTAGWESEYQQNPIVVGGGIFPIEKLRILPIFNRSQILKSVRYVDKAGTEGGDGAYTAMVLMHKLKDITFVIEDVERGRWGALEREQRIRAIAARDRGVIKGPYEIVVEQEPGSAGKESAEATIRNLAGYRVFADRVTGSKLVRAEPFAAQVQAGNVFLVAGNWVRDFLNEAECFPSGKFKDQIDAASGAFARLTSKPAL